MAAVLLALQITRNIVKKIGGLHEDASKWEVRKILDSCVDGRNDASDAVVV